MRTADASDDFMAAKSDSTDIQVLFCVGNGMFVDGGGFDIVGNISVVLSLKGNVARCDVKDDT